MGDLIDRFIWLYLIKIAGEVAPHVVIVYPRDGIERAYFAVPEEEHRAAPAPATSESQLPVLMIWDHPSNILQTIGEYGDALGRDRKQKRYSGSGAIHSESSNRHGS